MKITDFRFVVQWINRFRRQPASVSARPSVERRQGGQWRGRVQVADDFDSLPPDVMNAFHGGER